jgi:hypothetical protein
MRGSDGDRERRSPYLPTGYRLDETDPDEVVLKRADGSKGGGLQRDRGRSEGDGEAGVGGL